MNVPELLGVGLMLIGSGLGLGLTAYGATSFASGKNVSPLTGFAYAFLLTLALQAFHLVEHVAQVIQKFVLNSPQAHGLIGQLDLEQVHFVFNLLYLALLIHVLLRWLTLKVELPNRWRVYTTILTLTVALQSYHQVEHTVKLVQFIQTNVQGTPGIFGLYFDFDGVIFHFIMNTLVFLPGVVVFYCAGLHRQLSIRELFGRQTLRQSAELQG